MTMRPGRIAIVAAVMAGLAGPAVAGGVRPVTDATTKKECGACHMAYPAGLLPKAAWVKMMGDLSNHFGEDASLPDNARRQITDYYVGAASDRGDASVLRISEANWFTREHRRKSAKIRWSDCKACHKGAEQGNFDDD